MRINNSGVKGLKRELKVLSEAVEIYTTYAESTEIKSGLKCALYYLIKKACNIIKSSHLMEGRDEATAEIDKFIPVFELNHEFIFGDATYQINHRRKSGYANVWATFRGGCKEATNLHYQQSGKDDSWWLHCLGFP